MQFDEFINKVGEDRIKAAVADGDASEFIGLMQDEGVELTDEMLEDIAGGLIILESNKNFLNLFGSQEAFKNFMQSLRAGLTYL